ncbi:hypothetical protein T4D_5275 [Trichinella pseudospiralis]|uniref:Uncharacterized protein n=1 Tax=Trichinella pseudospiralis TaxID=6337 RepID=A0A0V1F5A5_TRIPS|nr:hypothetical protein T4D_5275 [Trichinella pseudospiralis]
MRTDQRKTPAAVDLSRPCQPITASEQLHDSAKGPTSSWSVVVSDQYHVTESRLLLQLFPLTSGAEGYHVLTLPTLLKSINELPLVGPTAEQVL